MTARKLAPFALGLAVAAVLALAARPAEAQTAPKIGVFDPQRITTETAEGARIQARLNALQEKKRGELQKSQDDLKKLQDQFAAGAVSMSEDKKKDLLMQIERKQLELEGMQKTASRELQLEAEQAQQQWQRAVLAAVSAYGKDKGYTLLLPTEVTPFFSPSIDVTDDLIKAIDAAKPAAAPAAGAK
ncbi:MAG: OmpH family outer membrane protein [Acidobacteria bacterium]|jgi:Skp family chaperone for outer membrane proteins|nr:OmpH family outer membrane protein [Acidobacteriota bacterium]